MWGRGGVVGLHGLECWVRSFSPRHHHSPQTLPEIVTVVIVGCRWLSTLVTISYSQLKLPLQKFIIFFYIQIHDLFIWNDKWTNFVSIILALSSSPPSLLKLLRFSVLFNLQMKLWLYYSLEWFKFTPPVYNSNKPR